MGWWFAAWKHVITSHCGVKSMTALGCIALWWSKSGSTFEGWAVNGSTLVRWFERDSRAARMSEKVPTCLTVAEIRTSASRGLEWTGGLTERWKRTGLVVTLHSSSSRCAFLKASPVNFSWAAFILVTTWNRRWRVWLLESARSPDQRRTYSISEWVYVQFTLTLIGVAVEKLVVRVSVLIRDFRMNFTTGICSRKISELLFLNYKEKWFKSVWFDCTTKQQN